MQKKIQKKRRKKWWKTKNKKQWILVLPLLTFEVSTIVASTTACSVWLSPYTLWLQLLHHALKAKAKAKQIKSYLPHGCIYPSTHACIRMLSVNCCCIIKENQCIFAPHSLQTKRSPYYLLKTMVVTKTDNNNNNNNKIQWKL